MTTTEQPDLEGLTSRDRVWLEYAEGAMRSARDLARTHAEAIEGIRAVFDTTLTRLTPPEETP